MLITDEQIHNWWAKENGLEDCDMCELYDFRKVVKTVEAMLIGLKEMSRPALKPGQAEFRWHDEGKELLCHIFYEPEERPSRTEGGSLAFAELDLAFLGDVDVTEWLKPTVVGRIEAAAIEYFELTKEHP